MFRTVLSRAATLSSRSVASSSSVAWTRSFGAAPSSSFLDRSEIEARVLEVIKHFPKVEEAKVTPTALFEKDLGLDSLDSVEIVMAFEDEFQLEIPDADAEAMQCADDAINYLVESPHAS
jgi:NADH dehydrogenase (ubiquinone) 1 alpha/beta subcomplex 1